MNSTQDEYLQKEHRMKHFRTLCATAALAATLSAGASANTADIGLDGEAQDSVISSKWAACGGFSEFHLGYDVFDLDPQVLSLPTETGGTLDVIYIGTVNSQTPLRVYTDACKIMNILNATPHWPELYVAAANKRPQRASDLALPADRLQLAVDFTEEVLARGGSDEFLNLVLGHAWAGLFGDAKSKEAYFKLAPWHKQIATIALSDKLGMQPDLVVDAILNDCPTHDLATTAEKNRETRNCIRDFFQLYPGFFEKIRNMQPVGHVALYEAHFLGLTNAIDAELGERGYAGTTVHLGTFSWEPHVKASLKKSGYKPDPKNAFTVTEDYEHFVRSDSEPTEDKTYFDMTEDDQVAARNLTSRAQKTQLDHKY